MNAPADDTFEGTTAVREAHRFDEAALERWMYANISGFEGPVRIEQFKGGQSNPTYKLTTPHRSYVLRRKPPGPVLAGAHDVEREARLLMALGHTNVPVPAVYGVCSDDTLIGTQFFIMEMVDGRIFWDATFPQVSRALRPAHFQAMNETIALLHTADYKRIGLSDYGKPGSYLARQIARWSKQYLQDSEAGRDPNMDALIEWLPANIPNQDQTGAAAAVTSPAGTALVHGDFRCDNLIFHRHEPKVLAVLDWELSTIGDPLADFAYHAMMYRMPPDIVAGLAGADLTALNIPSEADYVADYCLRTGRLSIPRYDFYIAFNFFRIAAIFHGIKGRVIRGTASSANAEERARSFPRLARLARESMEACK